MLATITFGYLVGTIATVVIVLAGLVWAFAFTGEGDLGPVLGGLGVALGAIILWVWIAFPPLSWDYHHWDNKTVLVKDVSKRNVQGSGGGFYEKFVVRDASGTFYGIDDTRAALVKPGDTVNLKCKKAYQWGVPSDAHGWDCRWAGANP